MTYGKQSQRSIGCGFPTLIKRSVFATSKHHYIQASATNQAQITDLIKTPCTIAPFSRPAEHAHLAGFCKKNQKFSHKLFLTITMLRFSENFSNKSINKNHIINFFKNTERDIIFYQCGTLPIISRDNGEVI